MLEKEKRITGWLYQGTACLRSSVEDGSKAAPHKGKLVPQLIKLRTSGEATKRKANEDCLRQECRSHNGCVKK